jgi:hypothetical protein
MPRAPAHARLCVVGVSLRPLSGLSPELSGEVDQEVPLGETRADVANSLLVWRDLPRHEDGHPFRGMSLSVRLDGARTRVRHVR